jgi:hypothetical protein
MFGAHIQRPGLDQKRLQNTYAEIHKTKHPTNNEHNNAADPHDIELRPA